VNIEETKKAIEVMQAFVDGKEIQDRNRKFGGEWYMTVVGGGLGGPMWSWSTTEYRVKPEPKEIWVNEYSDGSSYGYDCRDNAIAADPFGPLRKAVRYREVIEE
jgi:hypothetical protein